MRRLMLSGVVGLCALVLSGCGSVPVADAESRWPVVDQRRVGAVERIATRTGTRVYWINPPTTSTP